MDTLITIQALATLHARKPRTLSRIAHKLGLPKYGGTYVLTEGMASRIMAEVHDHPGNPNWIRKEGTP
jgi:hypothetical protein